MQISYSFFGIVRECSKVTKAMTCTEMQIATWWMIANVHKALRRFQLPCGYEREQCRPESQKFAQVIDERSR